jgi:hypothetical protein
VDCGGRAKGKGCWWSYGHLYNSLSFTNTVNL